MNITPTEHINFGLDSKRLVDELDRLTPDITLPSPKTQSYDWICENQQRHFKAKDFDRYRFEISDKEYWACEEEYLHSMCLRLISRSSTPSQHLKAFVKYYHKLIKKLGTPEETTNLQPGQKPRYWQIQATYFEPIVERQQAAFQNKLQQADYSAVSLKPHSKRETSEIKHPQSTIRTTRSRRQNHPIPKIRNKVHQHFTRSKVAKGDWIQSPGRTAAS
jgi:hypothetical protein